MRIVWCLAVVAIAVSVALAAPEAAQPLALSDAIGTALGNHASVAIAGRQVDQARAGVTVARAAYWPQLLGNWQWNFSRITGAEQTVTVGGVTTTVDAGGSREQHQTSLVTSYTLWDSGVRAARLRSARASRDRADSGLDLAHSALTFRVASSYLDLLRQQRALELARERVDQAKAHLALVEARINAGLAAQVDRYPLEAELAQAQLALVTAQNLVVQASIALRNSMGLPANGQYQAQEPTMTPEVTGLPSDQQAMAVADRTRPDLIEARAAERVARAVFDEAKVATRPVLSVGTTYLVKAEPSPTGTDLEVDAQVTVPIFDSGLRRAQAREAQDGLSISQLDLAQLGKDVGAEVTQARVSIVTAWERINAAAVSVNAARKSLESAEARYKQGMAIPIEITDAQVAYYNSQVEASNARYDYFTSLATLRNAVGLPTRSWDDLAESRVLQP